MLQCDTIHTILLPYTTPTSAVLNTLPCCPVLQQLLRSSQHGAVCAACPLPQRPSALQLHILQCAVRLCAVFDNLHALGRIDLQIVSTALTYFNKYGVVPQCLTTCTRWGASTATWSLLPKRMSWLATSPARMRASSRCGALYIKAIYSVVHQHWNVETAVI